MTICSFRMVLLVWTPALEEPLPARGCCTQSSTMRMLRHLQRNSLASFYILAAPVESCPYDNRMVSHGESYKRPGKAKEGRSTTKQKQLQSTQTTVDRHQSQIKHRTPPQNQPTRQVSYHPQTQLPCTNVKCTLPELHRPSRANVRV